MRSGLSLVLGHFLSSPVLGQQDGSLPQDCHKMGKLPLKMSMEFLCPHAGHEIARDMSSVTRREVCVQHNVVTIVR